MVVMDVVMIHSFSSYYHQQPRVSLTFTFEGVNRISDFQRVASSGSVVRVNIPNGSPIVQVAVRGSPC